METLLWLQHKVNLPCTFQAAVYAAEAGKINDLECLVQEFGLPLNSKLLEAAAESGELEMVKHIVARRDNIAATAFLGAFSTNQKRVVSGKHVLIRVEPGCRR